MKVYAKSNIDSRGIQRVEKAIQDYAPSYIEFVDDEKDADFLILHVNGRRDANVARAQNFGKSYAVIQYCLRSTQKPNTSEWMELWENADLVFSYYNLSEEMKKDGNQLYEWNFYLAPLGVSEAFEPKTVEKEYIACTSGHHYLTEGAREVILAAKEVGMRVAHLGYGCEGIENVDQFNDLTDTQVAELYSKCHFVSGLRTKEGFELPAAEATACGIRPILFDTPNYRQWYENTGALFIPEENRETTIEHLTNIFKEHQSNNFEKTPLDMREVYVGKHKFDWETIIKGFWSRL